MKVGVIYTDPQSCRRKTVDEFKAELEILDVVDAVRGALDELGHSSLLVPLHPSLEATKKKLWSVDADMIFNLFEGFDDIPETEGQVAAMLADREVPFTGCPPSALTLALDKARTKRLLEVSGIPTPRYQILNPDNVASFHLDYPCIVKPLAEDASHGISEESVVYSFTSLEKQVWKVHALFGDESLVEEYLDGREFNTTVMGNGRLTVSSISEIVYTLPPGKPKVLTFSAKWEENSLYFGNTNAVCPAAITADEQKKIGKIAKEAFKLVGCRGYARVDLRQDRAGNIKVLEINPNPDITPGSGAALQASRDGMTYSQFIDRIIRLAFNPK